jgi:predicted PurR-regulated permease PerM
MPLYSVNQSRIIALCLIILLGIFLIYSLSNLLTAILAAVILYVLFKPMFIYFSEKLKIKRAFSAAIVIVVSFIIIIMPFTGLVWMMTEKILYYKNHPETINQLIATLETFIGDTFDAETVNDVLNQASTWVLGLFSSFIDATLAIMLTVAMMYFFIYFMFTKHEVFEGTLIKYMPYREKNSVHFAKELKNMTFANVVGQGIISFAQALVLAIGFVIFGIPDPFFWGVICFFLSFLPVIGSAGVFVPAGLFELAAGDSFAGFGILIYGFVVVSNIDNLLRLWINKWIGDIHPLITITGIIIGLPIFGILGLVFGPLLISMFILLVRLYEEAFANEHKQKERVVDPEELS